MTAYKTTAREHNLAKYLRFDLRLSLKMSSNNTLMPFSISSLSPFVTIITISAFRKFHAPGWNSNIIQQWPVYYTCFLVPNTWPLNIQPYRHIIRTAHRIWVSVTHCWHNLTRHVQNFRKGDEFTKQHLHACVLTTITSVIAKPYIKLEPQCHLYKHLKLVCQPWRFLTEEQIT